jgi:hypothetical protein
MHARERRATVVAEVLVLLAIAGCASTTAPDAAAPTPGHSPEPLVVGHSAGAHRSDRPRSGRVRTPYGELPRDPISTSPSSAATPTES